MTNIETLCLNCMMDKGEQTRCSQCGEYSQKRNVVALPPKTILNNRFVIGRVLGKPGGFGVTYLAWDMLLDTTAAIKEFLPLSSVSRDVDTISVRANSKQDHDFYKQGLQIFLQEAKTLAQFSHPNIVRIRDYFSANNTAYLVMEYHKGRPLDQVVADEGGWLSEDRALQIILPILKGLDAVHNKGFLHRDIKPQNIYITDNGVPILLDFGASRYAIADSTQTLTVMLSAGYAPFEQYHKKGKQGPWSDIYSISATLYFMVTGEMPVDALERQHDDSIVSPIKYNPLLSESFCLAIMQAMAPSSHARPQNINALKQIIVGHSFLPAAINQSETGIHAHNSTHSSSVKKRDRQALLIQHSSSQSKGGVRGIFTYTALSAILLWLVWLPRSMDEERTDKLHLPIGNRGDMVLMDEEDRRLISTSYVSTNNRHIEGLKNSTIVPTIFVEQKEADIPQMIIQPPIEQKIAEAALPHFKPIAKHPHIPESAILACKSKKMQDNCRFVMQNHWRNGVCLPAGQGGLGCFPPHPPPPKRADIRH